MGKQTNKPPSDRRRSPLRKQAQGWFDVLQRHICDIEGADAIASLIKGWKKPEDIMRANPALVPLVLDIIWHARKTAGFADLFRTVAGEVAEKSTDVLALSQKCFDDIVVAHLLGTMRLTCERLQKEWIAREQERRRNALNDIPVLGALLRGLGVLRPIKTEFLLADYPHKGLYEALKPFLTRRDQFALVEVLADMPTRTVTAIGPVIGALDSPALLRTITSLDKADLRIALEMAETFVDAAGVSSVPTKTSPVDPAASVAVALSDMLRPGTDFVTVAAPNRQLAKDAIIKFAPVMKKGSWAIFGDAESLRRIAECPAGVAQTLRELTVEMHQRVSMVLSEIAADQAVTAFALKTLRAETDPVTFLAWIRGETYLLAWKQFVAQLNRDAAAPRAEGPLSQPLQASIKVVCERGARVFAEIGGPQKQAA